MDNPKCPRCEQNNALLREGEFIICRNPGCRYVDPTLPEFNLILTRNVLRVIQARTRSGIGLRTTETDELFRLAVMGARPSNVSHNDGSDAARSWFNVGPRSGLMKEVLFDLRSRQHIKFVTEERPSYCWIVPFNWRDDPRAGYVHVPKHEVPEPFDLW